MNSKYICFLLFAFIMIGCEYKVTKSQITYNKQSKILFYKNKPYTGTVYGEEEEAFWSAEVKDGVIISETEKYPNGSKMIKEINGDIKCHNKDGKEISKDEFQAIDGNR